MNTPDHCILYPCIGLGAQRCMYSSVTCVFVLVFVWPQWNSCRQVFNLNAPVPPASETDALNQASQYQNSYSQGFGNQDQLSAEASEMQSEQLQSGEPNGSRVLFPWVVSRAWKRWRLVTAILAHPTPLWFPEVGAFHSPDQSGSHQQASQQGAGFNRQGQSFYNSRGMSRGGPRNARGMMNGYRGSPNGFRGTFDPKPFWYWSCCRCCCLVFLEYCPRGPGAWNRDVVSMQALEPGIELWSLYRCQSGIFYMKLISENGTSQSHSKGVKGIPLALVRAINPYEECMHFFSFGLQPTTKLYM